MAHFVRSSIGPLSCSIRRNLRYSFFTDVSSYSNKLPVKTCYPKLGVGFPVSLSWITQCGLLVTSQFPTSIHKQRAYVALQSVTARCSPYSSRSAPHRIFPIGNRCYAEDHEVISAQQPNLRCARAGLKKWSRLELDVSTTYVWCFTSFGLIDVYSL